MQAATRAALPNLLRAEIVAIGVAGALARDHPHAHAQGNSLYRALDDRFVDAEAAGCQVFEVQIGVVPARRKRLDRDRTADRAR